MRLREAVRTLRRSPGTSLVVVATVAVGICAVVTVFAVVDAFFLKTLPGVARQSELVMRRDLVVRGGGTFAALAAALRREIRAAEPNLPFAAVLAVRRHMGISLLPQQAGSAVAGSLGLVGLLLAAIGLAAQVAHSVTRRTREIGIRMALGARPADVFLLEASRGAKTAGVGLVLGLAGALLLSRALAKFLFGVSPADPLTFGAVALLLAAVSLAAILSPARRAARISPLEALRNE